MKNLPTRSFFTVLALFVFLLSGNWAAAKDVPVDAKSVLGRWILLDVKTPDAESRAVVLAAKLDMTFMADKTLVVSNQNPETISGIDTRKGVYQVQNGKIVVKLDGEAQEDPARVVIRDGKYLVFTPTEKFPGEMIFARAPK